MVSVPRSSLGVMREIAGSTPSRHHALQQAGESMFDGVSIPGLRREKRYLTYEMLSKEEKETLRQHARRVRDASNRKHEAFYEPLDVWDAVGTFPDVAQLTWKAFGRDYVEAIRFNLAIREARTFLRLLAKSNGCDGVDTATFPFEDRYIWANGILDRLPGPGH